MRGFKFCLFVFSLHASRLSLVDGQALTQLCSETNEPQPTLQCQCNEFQTQFTSHVDEFARFHAVQRFVLSDCDSAILKSWTFYQSSDLRIVDLRRINNVTFDVELPHTVREILLTDISYLDNLTPVNFNFINTLTNITFQNVVIGNVESRALNTMTINRVSFVNVTFSSLKSEALALNFAENEDEKPTLIFDSCRFEGVDVTPFSITGGDVSTVRFVNNVLNCTDLEDQVRWLGKVFENVYSKSDKGMCCDTLARNYCDMNDGCRGNRMIDWLFESSELEANARKVCPDLYAEFFNESVEHQRQFEVSNLTSDGNLHKCPSYQVSIIVLAYISVYIVMKQEGREYLQ